MQRYKTTFPDETIRDKTFSNIQTCIRLNDFELLGDGTHCGVFHMMGLFSFRHWSIDRTIDFWLEFIQNKMKIPIDYVTIHPDKISEWSSCYTNKVEKITVDGECKWSDGSIGGYCTEFYSKNIEIGNIVNPLGTCIDVGFGLERLSSIVFNEKPRTKLEELEIMMYMLIKDGYIPSNTGPGYVLRKVIRTLLRLGYISDDDMIKKEKDKVEKCLRTYYRLKEKHLDKSDQWWYDTHGIKISEII